MKKNIFDINNKAANHFIDLYGPVIYKLIRETHNDGDLGSKIRKLYFTSIEATNG